MLVNVVILKDILSKKMYVCVCATSRKWKNDFNPHPNFYSEKKKKATLARRRLPVIDLNYNDL